MRFNFIVLIFFRLAISRVYNIALKGSRDLESEYISNIFSDIINPENISSYISLRTLLENRLSHQTQQYNMNMGKSNTTMAMPLNELRGHVKTFNDLSSSKLTVSTKAQHGMIAASLHDSYVTLINLPEFWNDRTYMKFFFNEDDPSKRDMQVVTRDTRFSLENIAKNIEEVREDLFEISSAKMKLETEKSEKAQRKRDNDLSSQTDFLKDVRNKSFTDKMLTTPFGKQYGSKIDAVIEEIFSIEKDEKHKEVSDDYIKSKLPPLFELFNTSSPIEDHQNEIIEIVDYLLIQDYGVKTAAEQNLYTNKKETFNKFYSATNKELIEIFFTRLFSIYFEWKFESLFRIIKSLDMKKFACAYIMKRIYLTKGENLTNFGYFFIRTIANTGGIKLDEQNK